MRLDKWLWAARWFKTRGLAQDAIAAGRVKLHDEKTKPAHPLKVGDWLEIRVGESVWHVQVTALSDKRGPAAQARKLAAAEEKGLLEKDPARIRPTRQGRLFLNELLQLFLD